MTNQHKFELAIAQAQKRGWEEGVPVRISPFYPIRIFCGKNYGISLNDILFGTDFCEKFFRNIELCKPCNHVLAACEYGNAPLCHKIEMLSMSESERIDFLYKHVEKNHAEQTHQMAEEQCERGEFCDVHNKKPQPVNISKEQSKAEIEFVKKCLGVEPVEVKKIEPLELVIFEGDFDYTVNKALRDMPLKINELITQVNANTKDIAENKMD